MNPLNTNINVVEDSTHIYGKLELLKLPLYVLLKIPSGTYNSLMFHNPWSNNRPSDKKRKLNDSASFVSETSKWNHSTSFGLAPPKPSLLLLPLHFSASSTSRTIHEHYVNAKGISEANQRVKLNKTPNLLS